MSDEQPIQPENERADAGQLAPPQSAQPNMEEWIARYGGRARIPWAEWDRAVEDWKAERRAEFKRKKLLGRMQSAASHAEDAILSMWRSGFVSQSPLVGRHASPATGIRSLGREALLHLRYKAHHLSRCGSQ